MSGWYLETTGPRILHHNSELDEGRRSGLRGADTRVCSVETRLDVVRGEHEMFGSASKPAPLVRTASRRVSTLQTRVLTAPRRVAHAPSMTRSSEKSRARKARSSTVG